LRADFARMDLRGVVSEDNERQMMATYIAAFKTMRNALFGDLTWTQWRQCAYFATKAAFVNPYPVVKACGSDFVKVCQAFPILARRMLLPETFTMTGSVVELPNVMWSKKGKQQTVQEKLKDTRYTAPLTQPGYFYTRIDAEMLQPMFTTQTAWETCSKALTQPHVLGINVCGLTRPSILETAKLPPLDVRSTSEIIA
jgi:hypothetical protein